MYYPKSKIVSDQYTNGNELVYRVSKKPYTGKYHILANGKLYTGANTTDGVPQEIVYTNLKDHLQEGNTLNTTTSTAYDSIRKQQNINPPMVELLEPKYTQPAVKYPILTRYFLRRTNNAIFTEVSLEDYTVIKDKDKKYNWGIYIPFELPWSTSGAYIKETNERMVLLTEQRYKVYGFTQYITNYTEFSI